MGQSLAKIYMHLIFSTKHREALIHPPYEQELYKYLGGICKNLGCQPIKVGGYQNHVHILCMLSKMLPLAKLMEKLKANSSKWMKTNDDSLSNFYWQDGYGAFSVSPGEVDRVERYIGNQAEHHRNKGFKEEYREFLEKYSVDYDERYVWD